ncbi:hypothetical protein PSHT_16107 [Puccinia striiformis]|uniref:Uncharacterized protein n=1 Tax=Puccinia striiformis TaxID=27350 RepID=A0A2S4UC14_9BASI|nr:hypothetical protein PSHT_16107 [Puccinia striiformis]
MSQQPRPAPYQRRPVPYPPPYERVASHPYGLRPRVTPIRSYGPVPRPTPVRPANNIPARRPGFVQRGVASMPVIRNVPFLSDSATQAAHVQRVVDFHAKSVWDLSRLGQPFFIPVYNPNARDTPMYPPSPVFDRVIRHPSPFPFPPDWSVFFRDAESSQGSSLVVVWTLISLWSIALVLRRLVLQMYLSELIALSWYHQRLGLEHVDSSVFSRNPPGYVPSPRAATWGQRRRSDRPLLVLMWIRSHAFRKPEGLNPYDRHVFSNRVPKDKYRFAVVRSLDSAMIILLLIKLNVMGRVAFRVLTALL